MNKQTYSVRGAEITAIERSRRTYSNREWREYWSAPRMYISIEDETVFDNLVNRKRRPYNEYKKMIHSSGVSSMINLETLQWRQNAGCTLCPCSPGFIIPVQEIEINGVVTRHFDLWVTLTGAPSVDERKARRVIAVA